MASEPAARPWMGDLTLFLLYILVVAATGPLLFGFHLAELNAPQAVITCVQKSLAKSTYLPSLPQCIPMTAFEIGLVSSIFTLGGLLGALGAGPCAAKYGRLSTMRWNTIFFVLGPAAEACAANVTVMALGRLVSGLGAGAAVVVVPIYISEAAPPALKGFFGSLTQVMTNAGILTTQLLGLFLSKGQLWRVILGVGGIIGMSQLGGLLFAIESPKWNAEHGQPSQAKVDLRRIRGSEAVLHKEISGWIVQPDEQREAEEDALLDNDSNSDPSLLAPSHSPPGSVKRQTIGIFNVLLHPQYKRATLSIMLIMVAQQLCGINSIVMYGVDLLSDLLTTSSALLNVFVALLNLVVTAACAPLVDRLGRKPCLLLSIIGMGLSSLLLGIAIVKGIAVLSAVAVLTFVGSFGVGLGPVPFILASELVGPEAVGATQSWALAANWISTFVVAQFFPMVNSALGKGRVYFVFAAVAAASATFVFLLVPETKGKRDADEVWGRGERRQD